MCPPQVAGSCGSFRLMKVQDQTGHEIDASFEVECPQGGPPAVVFLSRSGTSAAGTARHADYDQGLRLLLERLGSIGAVLVDALVDSGHTRKHGLPEGQRRIPLRDFDYPLPLATVASGELRKAIGRGQTGVARKPGVKRGGNPNKQIRLVLRLPESISSDPERLGRFLATGKIEVRHFALIANQHVYDVEAAAATLEEDTWSLPEGNVEPGDRVVFWRTLGPDGKRGIVAFGEVISRPTVMEDPPEAAPFWLGVRPVSPLRRFRLRYLRPSKLPLWLDEDTSGTLASLTVSRGQETKLYRVTPDQMEALVSLAGGWDTVQSACNALPRVQLVTTPDEVAAQHIEEEVVAAADAATSKRRGQGYSADPAFRAAVELHAMDLAKAYLKGLMGTEMKNTSANQPYDFECPNAPHHRFVEVKGTTGDGTEVFLTANEVEHARAWHEVSALVVVHGIQVERDPEGRWVATGGSLRDISPWSPDSGTLRPLAYRYVLPG